MREMKDSGIEWIGEMPSDWKRSRLGYVCDEFIVPMRDKPQKFDGDIPWCRIEDIEGKYINGTKSNQYVSQDTIDELKLKVYPIGTIINSCSATIGVSAIVTRPLCTNQTFIGLVSGKTINNIYLFWLMNALGDYQKFTGHGSTITYISQDKYRKMDIPLPDKNEQLRIADFLDSKCAKIDSIIEKQQAIIEKLKEYKLSVITETVTKGLNPDIEMKDSGIKWIGRIPKHWKVSKLKYLFGTGDDSLKIGPFGSSMKGKTLESGPYKIYNQAHLIQNDFNLNRHFVSEETFEELSSYEVKPDDILFSMMGTIGKCQIMPSGYQKGIMDSHLLKARLNEKILPQFFVYAYDKDYSSQVIQQLLYVSNGTIMNGLNSSILKNVIIALPPVNEQQEITKYLDKFIQEVDMRIAKVTKVVDRLQEYKKSLIYEVVTGKKEV